MTIKYLAVDYSDNAGQNPEVFDTLQEANACIENAWDRLTDYEKKRAHYYVAKVTEKDLTEPGDWTSFDDYETGLDFFDSDEIAEILVRYEAGESRWEPGKGIDYMLTRYTPDGKGCTDSVWAGTYKGEYTELYAELENWTWDGVSDYCEDDEATYEDLKAEIIEQAEENGLHPSRLSFWND